MDDATRELIRMAMTMATVPIVTMTTSWLKQQAWTNEGKRLLTFGISLIAAAIVALIDGRGSLETTSSLALMIFMAARTFYSQYFEATDLNQTLTQIGADHAD